MGPLGINGFTTQGTGIINELLSFEWRNPERELLHYIFITKKRRAFSDAVFDNLMLKNSTSTSL